MGKLNPTKPALLSLLFCSACHGGGKDPIRPVMGDLAASLAAIATRYKLKPLQVPIAGLKPGWVFESNRRLMRSCFSPDTVFFPSLASEHIVGGDTSSASVNLGLKILQEIGVGISGGTESIKGAELTLTNASLGMVDGLSFRWDSLSCWQEVETSSLPVVVTVLQFGSIAASVVTSSGKRIAIDSSSLNTPEVKLSLAGKWSFANGGQIVANGNDLVVGGAFRDLTIMRHICPTNSFDGRGRPSSYPVRIGGPLDPVPCDNDEPWYRFKIESVKGDSVWFEYQRLGPAGGSPVRAGTRIGQEVVLLAKGRRTDRAVVDTSADSPTVSILRYEIVDRGTEVYHRRGGAQAMENVPPLPDDIALQPLRRDCRESSYAGHWIQNCDTLNTH